MEGWCLISDGNLNGVLIAEFQDNVDVGLSTLGDFSGFLQVLPVCGVVLFLGKRVKESIDHDDKILRSNSNKRKTCKCEHGDSMTGCQWDEKSQPALYSHCIR
jgi:hypothetical protein